MTSGWRGAPYFRRYGREPVLKTGDFVKEKLEGGVYRRTTPDVVGISGTFHIMIHDIT